MSWLARVEVERSDVDTSAWPWVLPAVLALHDLALDSGVTFFAGENGSGKSTVLEALAVACGCPHEGGPSNRWLKGPKYGTDLAVHLRPQLRGVPVGGAWFLRSETFFNLATAATEAASKPGEYADAQLLADFGWRSPHALSHGQSYLGLFESRMGAESLWFLDEPEAPLSFRSQLALMRTLRELALSGSQFIVATHSPVLLSMPGATIYEFGDDGVHRVAWDDLDVVQQIRGFLEAPERYLRHIFD